MFILYLLDGRWAVTVKVAGLSTLAPSHLSASVDRICLPHDENNSPVPPYN